MASKSKHTIRDNQLDKMLKYPNDRIAFYSEQNAANADRREIAKYMKGEINLEKLCKEVARNNHLPKVTETQMLNELRIMKWLKE